MQMQKCVRLGMDSISFPGWFVVEEPIATRDHSERMLKGFGADLSVEPLDGGEALLHMADGAKVPCSRRQLPLLRQALGAG